MKMVFLGDRETHLLFSLEGMECRIVEKPEEAVEEIKKIKKTKAYGLLIVTQQVALWAIDQVNQLRFSKELPLVIDIPSAQGEIDTGKKLSDYIREAVGIRI